METKAMMKLENMRFYAYHGCLEQERTDGNEFTVTLEYDYDSAKAAETDDLKYAIDYSVIFKIVEKEMAKPSNLLENVAHRIVVALRKQFPQITAGKVTVTKMHPPVGGRCDSSSAIELF